MKSGETPASTSPARGTRSFNQPPTVKSGETNLPGPLAISAVPFQSAPDGEVGGDEPAVRMWTVLDSFQSAPDGEVGGDCPGCLADRQALEFQSAPDGEVGGDRTTSRPRHRPRRCWSFNQPPTVKSGETRARWIGRRSPRGFNQPPTVKSGETAISASTASIASCFNQPPTVKSGETWSRSSRAGPSPSFNQPPTVKSGETGLEPDADAPG